MLINDWRNLVFESDLTPKARLVAFALAKYYRQGKECYPSFSTLRDDTGYTNNHTIGDAVKELQEAGFIRVRKGKIRNLSVQSQSYEFVGVQTGEVTGEVTGEKNALEIENKRNNINNINNIYKKNTKKSFSQEFETWWSEYPRKVAKGQAEKIFSRLLEKKKVSFNELLDGVKRYAEHCRNQNTESEYIKHPSTWLNGECWADEFEKKEQDFSWLQGVK